MKIIKKLYKAFTLKRTMSSIPGGSVMTPEMLDQLHTVLLSIVDDIMEVCREEKLTVILGGGSALGAIRHQGFIPWDDDIDLNMTRESFQRFVPAFLKKYGDKYWIHSPSRTPQYGVTVCKVCKKGTIFRTSDTVADESEAGVFVDIFMIENIYDGKVKRWLQGRLSNLCKACMSCRKFYRDRKSVLKAMGDKVSLPSAIRLCIGFVCSFMSVEKWTLLTNKVFSMCKDNTTKQVSIPSGRWHFFGSIHDRDTFCVMKDVPFEGRMYPVCIGLEEYMTQLYGADYMQVPPPEKREEHVCFELNLGKDYEYLKETIKREEQ